MFRAARARRITTATAFGGGGLTLLGAGTIGLLYLQVRLAHRAIQRTNWAEPQVNGVYGSGDGAPLSLVMMGDSTAAGFALTDGLQTPGSLLATGISAIAERPVRMHNVAVVGATSADLAKQVERVRGTRADVAVLFIGANDVIQRLRPADSARHLSAAARELTTMGTAVVVGTCPDLGTVEHIGWPLRYIARRASRQLAAVQTIATVEGGGRTVSLGALLADEFQANPDDMFGPDRFHPSARGYAHAASAVLPSACVALGMLPELESVPDPSRGEEVLPIDRAAVEAAEEPGMEVSGARVAGHESGPRGRWATLIRRRSRAVPGGRGAKVTPGDPASGSTGSTPSK
ncbi:lysophospholipase L1-like esterase [Lipingzhangella halophila]|uniref:Lysophospholipase L1-like esterase n=1 Tax=Lipingzhangella halophila TaxID=1783352 RepID=A0A7W7W0C4_9ACTN|nr:SGNH/GDSL hydrolase family protein [Lipingzhangella halophila]MBB4929757.1 lysophospholipase L1-like esterase [Lipingzhangella halophila]